MGALYKGMWAAAAIALVAFYPVTQWILGGQSIIDPPARRTLCAIIGVVVTVAMVFLTDYYTSTHYKPVKSIAAASETGAGTNIIQGLAVGMQSTTLPVLVIVLATIVELRARPASSGSAWLRSRCSRWRASSSPSTRSVPSLTTPAASPRWPSFPRKSGPSPTPSTPWATPRRPSPRATRSARRPSRRSCCSPSTPAAWAPTRRSRASSSTSRTPTSSSACSSVPHCPTSSPRSRCRPWVALPVPSSRTSARSSGTTPASWRARRSRTTRRPWTWSPSPRCARWSSRRSSRCSPRSSSCCSRW